jgi:glycosyltransferase involved in cell wall biosynthesis
MTRSPLVSVVVPTHNRRHLIGRAIRSVLNQTLDEWELIVVDDASQDGTEEEVRRFEDRRLRYVRREVNGGGGASRNTGIEIASGEFVAFLDSDDEWLPHKLDRQVSRFRNSGLENVGLVYTGAVITDGSGVEDSRPARHRGELRHALLKENVVGSTSTGMVPRAVLRHVGGFDEDLPAKQDLDLWLRIAEEYAIECEPECLVVIHQVRSERRITTDFRARVTARAKFSQKYRERLAEAGLLAPFHVQTGRYEQFQLRDGKAARRWYRRALKADRFSGPALALWGSTFMPGWLQRSGLDAYKRLKRAIRDRR